MNAVRKISRSKAAIALFAAGIVGVTGLVAATSANAKGTALSDPKKQMYCWNTTSPVSS